LNELLKDAEPPRHDKWDPSLIKDRCREKLARESLHNLDSLVLDELKKKYEVVHEFTMDSGEGYYLPDDVDDMGRAQTSDDILRVNQKVQSVVRDNKVISTQMSGSQDSLGGTLQGDVYGNKSRKKTVENRTIVFGSGDSLGMTQSTKGSLMKAINIVDQRAFSMNSDIGLYRVIIKSDSEHERVFMSFSSIGEDNSRNTLDIEGYSVNGNWVNTSQEKIGPLDFEEGKPLTLLVKFKEKEKMLLDVYAEKRIE
jgi:hypothetical protein